MNTTESVSNHTPGPWTASRGSRRSDVIDYIKVGAGFLSFTRGIGQTNAEVASNTRMAAAAPELLAAIAELLSQLEQGMECHGIAANSPTTKNAISQARAAIAKASPGHPLANP